VSSANKEEEQLTVSNVFLFVRGKLSQTGSNVFLSVCGKLSQTGSNVFLLVPVELSQKAKVQMNSEMSK
jgi:hypothetical protein